MASNENFRPTEASAATGFSGNQINRRAEWREDETRIDSARTASGARYILFKADQPLLRENGATLEIFHEREKAQKLPAHLESAILLGENQDGPVWCARLSGPPEEIEALGPYKFIDLRSLAMQGILAEGDLGLLAQARAMLYWHSQYRFCGRCGGKLNHGQAGYKLECGSCGHAFFPRTDPVAIMLAVHEDKCLLGRQPRFVEGMYSCLAGFIEPGETIENAVRRETLEEAGIHLADVRYHASQPWPFPGSLMIGCLGKAINKDIVMDAEELDDCRWFHRDEVFAMMDNNHPDGQFVPPKMAIAHHLIRAFAHREIEFD